MIKFKTETQKAFCDACGNQLHIDEYNIHYGNIKSHFGYGSKFDALGTGTPREYDLCDKCWAIVHKALNIPVTIDDIPDNLQVKNELFLIENDKIFTGEINKEVYPIPIWACKKCGWEDSGRGYSIPDHRH